MGVKGQSRLHTHTIAHPWSLCGMGLIGSSRLGRLKGDSMG